MKDPSPWGSTGQSQCHLSPNTRQKYPILSKIKCNLFGKWKAAVLQFCFFVFVFKYKDMT